MFKIHLLTFTFLLISIASIGQNAINKPTDSTFNFCYYVSIIERGLKKIDIDRKFGTPVDSTRYLAYNANTDKHDIPLFEYEYKVFYKFDAWTVLTIQINKSKNNKIEYLKLTIESQGQWFLDTKETEKCGFKFLKTIGSIKSNMTNYYLKGKVYCTLSDLINTSKKHITIGKKY